MGTKRPFDENFQEFIKCPKPDSLGEEIRYPEPSQNVVIVDGGDEKVVDVPDMLEKASGPGPMFCPGLFSDLFEFNIPSRSLVHYDDTLGLGLGPSKEVPVGPDHQADVTEFDSDSARNYISQNEREGICVISHQEDATVITHTVCNCMDNGSIRCVQQHVREARLNLKESLGPEKFVNMGFNNMGEEVACNWNNEEQHFQDIIYSNPVSQGKRFWDILSIEFPTRTKKELVSYYFNVFIYRRRAIQNRSQLLAIDSDDDEWWGAKRGSMENEDFVDQNENFVDHEDLDALSEDGDNAVGVEENQLINGSPSSKSEQEKPTGLKSESYLHWDPPHSTMGSTKGVDLLPKCSMIEEIFGSGKST